MLGSAEILSAFLFLISILAPRKSNKFNALLYGHLYALLNTELFSYELKDIIKGSKNLMNFHDAIESRYYNNG